MRKAKALNFDRCEESKCAMSRDPASRWSRRSLARHSDVGTWLLPLGCIRLALVFTDGCVPA